MREVNIDIREIIENDEENKPFKFSPLRKFNLKTKDLQITIALMVITLAVSEILYSLGLSNESIILVHILNLSLISKFTDGYFYGPVAAVITAFVYDFFITYPRFGFSFNKNFSLTLPLMILVTIIMSTLTSELKRKTHETEVKEEQTKMLLEHNKEILSTWELEDIIFTTNNFLVKYLKRSIVFYIGYPGEAGSGYYSGFSRDLTLDELNTPLERSIAENAFETGEKSGYNTEYSPFSKALYFPITSNENKHGVLAISCEKSELTKNDEVFIKLMINQTALALEMLSMEKKQQKTIIEARTEKTRNNLLISISHDLKKPLNNISDASLNILESEEFENNDKKYLVEGIYNDSEFLIKTIESLLLITKINNKSIKIEKELENGTKTLNQSIKIVKDKYSDYSIYAKLPEEEIMIPMDKELISQVIVNLLENAIDNSTINDLVFVNLRKEDGFAVFEVSDDGKGITKEMEKELFIDDNIPKDGWIVDSENGIGIGLVICQAIIKAHNGKLHGENKETGGAKFTFYLPLEILKTQ